LTSATAPAKRLE